MAAVAVDANCIAQFQQERLGLKRGHGLRAIRHIMSNHHIVVDARKACEQEWYDCLKGPIGENLKDWVAEQQRLGKIVPVTCSPQPAHRAALQRLGFPQSDHKWVCLVASAAAIAMVSEDIDFYDPTRKKSPSRVTDPIKQNQRGPVARYFRRYLGAPVMMLNHVPNQI